MDQQVTLNHNAAECIKSLSNWGETVYTNICSGAVTHVPWGTMDYSVILTSIALALVLLYFLVWVLFSIMLDRY